MDGGQIFGWILLSCTIAIMIAVIVIIFVYKRRHNLSWSDAFGQLNSKYFSKGNGNASTQQQTTRPLPPIPNTTNEKREFIPYPPPYPKPSGFEPQPPTAPYPGTSSNETHVPLKMCGINQLSQNEKGEFHIIDEWKLVSRDDFEKPEGYHPLQYKHKFSNEIYYLIEGEQQDEYDTATKMYRGENNIRICSNEFKFTGNSYQIQGDPIYIPVTINVICWHINEKQPSFKP